MSSHRACLDFTDANAHLTRICQAVLAAADASAAVRQNLQMTDNGLLVGSRVVPLSAGSRVVLIALGKAAPTMAESACRILGHRLAEGVAAVPIGTSKKPPDRITFIPSGHPLPDAGSLEAAQRAVRLLRRLSAEDIALVLISGGGSAMFEMPMQGIPLQDLRRLDRDLLRSGAPIDALNRVRAACSQVKGGGLARLAAPARTAALILSDVLGDRLTVIASGPTVLRAPDVASARRELKSLGLWVSTPSSIRACLERRFVSPARTSRPVNVLIGNASRALDGARAAASAVGFEPRLVTRQLAGDAAAVGAALGRRLRKSPRPACWLLAGETTVHVDRTGRGGRNQELALAAAIAIQGARNVAVMTLATDGIDGPTDAAGAFVTGDTYTAMLAAGIDPLAALSRHDSHTVLDRVGALIRTGPTGTNVGDVVVCLAYPGDVAS